MDETDRICLQFFRAFLKKQQKMYWSGKKVLYDTKKVQQKTFTKI